MEWEMKYFYFIIIFLGQRSRKNDFCLRGMIIILILMACKKIYRGTSLKLKIRSLERVAIVKVENC